MIPAFRRAGPADAGAVRDLTRAAYARWVPILGREPLPMAADYDQAVEAHRIDLLEEAGALVALIEMAARDDYLFLVNVAVAPDRQGRGLGRVLLARAHLVAQALGLPELRLGANMAFAANLRFHQRENFEIFERRPLLGGMAALMRRAVAPPAVDADWQVFLSHPFRVRLWP